MHIVEAPSNWDESPCARGPGGNFRFRPFERSRMADARWIVGMRNGINAGIEKGSFVSISHHRSPNPHIRNF